jgi:hypothetical protein
MDGLDKAGPEIVSESSGRKIWQTPRIDSGSIESVTGKGSSFPPECDTSSKSLS